MTLKDICKRYTIVGEDGVNYCDTDNCPFAKRDLSIDFMPIDRYSCIADYPYLKENHETDLLKEFVEWLKHKQHISVENYKKLFEQTKNYLYCGKRDEAEYTLETLESDLEKFLEERK